MWPRRCHVLACLWGFAVVLLFTWLHVVVRPIMLKAAEEDDLPALDLEEDDPGNLEGDSSDMLPESAPSPAPTPAPAPATPAFGHLALRCSPEPSVAHPALEDNAPRLPPQEGDAEFASLMPEVLPGADVRHLHGKLGLFPNGTCCRIRPVQIEKRLKQEEKKEAHKGFSFNTRVSEALDVDRLLRDMRSTGCKKRVYACSLPKASVVIAFHNEHLVTLVRSVHSVLNTARPSLLREIVLVDDASRPKPPFSRRHWERLQGELQEYCQGLPKVRLVRLQRRRGLVGARMEGAWRTSGEVLVFLDSHVEATPGWLEPLLAYVRDHRSAVVMPSTGVISNDQFKYDRVPWHGPTSFTWSLAQHAYARKENDDIVDSPVSTGGHIAVDRAYFLHLGGFDLEMKFYGGEDVELGFRTWQCGGSIKHHPCSNVGHVFRQSNYWQGQVYHAPPEEITRNKLRTAEVWMDDWKEIVKLVSPTTANLRVGPLDLRLALRQKLGCKPFSWYLKNVAKEVSIPRLYKPRWRIALVNVMTNGCIDTLGEVLTGKRLGVYPCHPRPSAQSTQAVEMDASQGLVRLLKANRLCMARQDKKILLLSCQETASTEKQWTWMPVNGNITNVGRLQIQGQCLLAASITTPKSPYSLSLEKCSESSSQLWTWSG